MPSLSNFFARYRGITKIGMRVRHSPKCFRKPDFKLYNSDVPAIVWQNKVIFFNDITDAGLNFAHVVGLIFEFVHEIPESK